MKNTDININALEASLSLLPRLPYSEWLSVISGVANHFGEENALAILRNAGFKDERRNETEYKIRKRLRNVSIGSVIHILRKYSINHTDLYAHVFYNKMSNNAALMCKNVSQMPQRPQDFSQLRREPCIYRFGDDYVEEIAAQYQFDDHCSRYEAEQRIADEYPDVPKERLYRCAVSKEARNKTVLCGMGDFLDSFQNTALSAENLISVIQQGYAVTPFLFLGRKNQENWMGAELCFIDIDKGLHIPQAQALESTRNCLFMYTSPSHTEEHHRYRLVFPLPFFERDIEAYRTALQRTIALYAADTSCSDPAKFYFGNTSAVFWKPSEAKSEAENAWHIVKAEA